MYEIKYSSDALKQLESLEHNIKERILIALERIRIRPQASVKRLVGDPRYSLRVGDYRIILNIQNDKLLILVIKIGHRKNVYKS